MRISFIRCAGVCITLILLASATLAEVPQVIMYQGRLTTAAGQTVADGNYLIKFTIYDAPSAGTVLWDNGYRTVAVAGGMLCYALGDSTALPHNLFSSDTTRYLGIKVGADPEMTPRVHLTAQAYAYHALRADTAEVLTALPPIEHHSLLGLGNDDHLRYLPVDGSRPLVGSLNAGNNRITNLSPAIASGQALTYEQAMKSGDVAGGDLTGTYPNPQIAFDAVGRDEIAENAVGPEHIQPNAVGMDEIAMNAVGTSEIADNSVAMNDIADNAVGSGEIATDAVQSSEIAPSAVGSSEIQDGTVSSLDIADGTIVDADISATANIAPSKIAGTVATLGASQTFTGGNTFSSSLKVADSTMTADGSSALFGSTVHPGVTGVIELHRVFSSATAQYGLYGDLDNHVGAGSMYGAHVSALAGSGDAYGGEFLAHSPAVANNRIGVYARGYQDMAMPDQGTSYGVKAEAQDGATTYGIWAHGSGGALNWAGWFVGNVNVTGTLTKGAGAFRIDHPLDPENKYLQHSFVESPDMKDIYDGIVTLDANGQAVVALPEWFEPLNQDFRYQLTCIGAYAPVYIKTKITGNQFKIAGGTPSLEVSWQVTGIRHDKYAEANRIPVELDKKSDERGKYAHPEAFSLPVERGIDYERSRPARGTGLESLRE